MGQPWLVLEGDVRRVLRTLPAESFDGCLSDPPYGLKFMGNRWDYFVPSVNVFVEILRVLRPGAHAMFFGGSRTAHRMAVNIEDAGFELRDTCMWLYGSGMPKSTSVDKAIDKLKDTRDEVLQVTRWIRSARDRARSSNRLIDEHFGLKGMAGHWTTTKSQPLVPTAEQWTKLLAFLHATPPPAIAELAQKIIREKGVPGDAWFEREQVGVNVGAVTGSYAPGHEAKTVDRPITMPAQEESARWLGYGTNLKPGYEPVVLARKYMRGTIGENAIDHGTGGLAIDACRIGAAGGTAGRDYAKTGLFGMGGKATIEDIGKGRWPANVQLSHSPGCRLAGTRKVKTGVAKRTKGGGKTFGGNVPKPPMDDMTYADADGTETIEQWECADDCPHRMIDEQSGNRKSPKGEIIAHRRTMKTTVNVAPRAEHERIFGYGDDGGASRFFYSAKVSREERNRGMEEDDPNLHPTLKPIDLCRYYARLILPPPRRDGQPRRVIVTYSGSGSEMIGCLLAGWDEVVGIEIDPVHAAKARARIVANASRR